MKNKGCLILLIAGMVGLAFMVAKWYELTVPQPVNLNDDWTTFRVVSIDKGGKPAVMVLESYYSVREYKRTHTQKETREYFSGTEGRDILWDADNRRGGPYTFYIPANKAKAISETITKGFDDNLRYVTISVSDENPEANTETVRLFYYNDDYDGTSIYKVTPDGVTPILYGDRRKRDAFESFVFAFPAFFLSLIVLSIGFYIAGRLSRGRAA